MWEKHPDYQKQQARIIAFLLILLVICYAGYAVVERDWDLLRHVLLFAGAIIIALALVLSFGWDLMKIFTRKKSDDSEIREGDNRATPSNSTLPREFIICILMSVLIFSGIAFVIIRTPFLEEKYGKHNLIAHANLLIEFTVSAIFLVAPFIGGCNAFRLTRLAGRRTKLLGWFFLLFFTCFFLQATAISQSQYRSCKWILRERK